MAFFTASFRQLLPTPTQSGAPSPFGLAWLTLPQLFYNSVSNCLSSVLTELYNSSTPTQSPTRSLKWHVWSSSSGNNCHAVQRSIASGVSVDECIIGIFYLVPFHQLRTPTRSLSITGHWNVSLLSGASLYIGMFARAEGQNTTLPSEEKGLKMRREKFYYQWKKKINLHKNKYFFAISVKCLLNRCAENISITSKLGVLKFEILYHLVHKVDLQLP